VQMTAVERISAYGLLPPEHGYSARLEQQPALRSSNGNGSASVISGSKSIGDGSGGGGGGGGGSGSESESSVASQRLRPSLAFTAMVAASNNDNIKNKNTNNSEAQGGIGEPTTKGRLELRNLTVRYRPDLPPVLSVRLYTSR
jgi:hypothetical protein